MRQFLMNNKFQLQIKEIDKTMHNLSLSKQKQVIGGTSFERLKAFNEGGSLHETSKIISEVSPDLVIKGGYHHLNYDTVINDVTVVDGGKKTRIVERNQY